MATVTFTTLEARIRNRSSLENSDFATSAAILSHVNASYAELYDLLVATGADYFTTSVDFSMTGSTIAIAGTAPAAIGVSNFYKALGLDCQEGGSDTGYIEVPPFSMASRNRTRVRSYRIMGGSVYVYPPQLAAGSYRLWYVPQPTAVTANGSIEDYGGWSEYLIADVCAKLLTDQELDPTPFLAEKQSLRSRIEGMAKSRDYAAPPVVQDVHGAAGWWC